MAGCYPVVSNEKAAQQDLIGDVNVSATVCEAPEAAGLFGSVLQVLINGDTRVRTADLRAAARRVAVRGVSDKLFDCADEPSVSKGAARGVVSLPHQMLVAYRVPAGAKAPETFTAQAQVAVPPSSDTLRAKLSTAPRGYETTTQTVTFRRATELDAQMPESFNWAYEILGELANADVLKNLPWELTGDGQQAVGYVSDEMPGAVVGDMALNTAFGLPGGTGDRPAAGSFNALTLVGSRITLPEAEWAQVVESNNALEGMANPLTANRQVACLPSRPSGTLSSLEDQLALLGKAVCPHIPLVSLSGVNSAEQYVASLDEQELLAGVDTQTRDLRLVGSEGFAEQGQTATVPFTFRTAGAESDTQLALNATTALAGATATPHRASTGFPASGDHPAPVTVKVPDTAAPGTYDVTLTTTVGGQTRTAGGKVVVLPKPAPVTVTTPVLSAPKRDNLYMDRDGNVAFGWICPSACGNATVDVTAPKAGIAPRANTAAVSKPRLLRIARGTFDAKVGQRVRVKVKLFPKARKAIRNGRTVNAIIVVRANGSGTPAVRRVTLRQRAR